MKGTLLPGLLIALLGVTLPAAAQRPLDPLNQGVPQRGGVFPGRVPIGGPVGGPAPAPAPAPAPQPSYTPAPSAPPSYAPAPGGAPSYSPPPPPPAAGQPPAVPVFSTTAGASYYESALAAPDGVMRMLVNVQKGVGFPYGTLAYDTLTKTTRYQPNSYIWSPEMIRDFAPVFNLPVNDDRAFTGTNFGSFDVQNGRLLITGAGVWTKLVDPKNRVVYVKYHIPPFEVGATANSNLTRFDVPYDRWQAAVDRPMQNLDGAMAQLASRNEIMGRFNQLQQQRPSYRILSTLNSQQLRADIVWTSMRIEHFPDELKNTQGGYVELLELKRWLQAQGFPETLTVQMDGLMFGNAQAGIDLNSHSFGMFLKPTVMGNPGIQPIFLGPYIY